MCFDHTKNPFTKKTNSREEYFVKNKTIRKYEWLLYPAPILLIAKASHIYVIYLL